MRPTPASACCADTTTPAPMSRADPTDSASPTTAKPYACRANEAACRTTIVSTSSLTPLDSATSRSASMRKETVAPSKPVWDSAVPVLSRVKTRILPRIAPMDAETPTPDLNASRPRASAKRTTNAAPGGFARSRAFKRGSAPRATNASRWASASMQRAHATQRRTHAANAIPQRSSVPRTPTGRSAARMPRSRARRIRIAEAMNAACSP